jgi:hypothetical protein
MVSATRFVLPRPASGEWVGWGAFLFPSPLEGEGGELRSSSAQRAGRGVFFAARLRANQLIRATNYAPSFPGSMIFPCCEPSTAAT